MGTGPAGLAACQALLNDLADRSCLDRGERFVAATFSPAKKGLTAVNELHAEIACGLW
jgi:hypothetical protein